MVSVNLLPKQIVNARRRNRRVRVWATVLITVSALAAVPLAVDVSKAAGAASMESRLLPVQEQLKEARAELLKASTECTGLAGQIARADALRGKRAWSGLLALISAKAPDAIWLTAMTTRTAQAQPASPAPAGAAPAGAPEVVTLRGPGGIHLEGYALDHEWLYGFMSALKESQVFRQVELTSAGKEPMLDGTAVRFVLECYW